MGSPATEDSWPWASTAPHDVAPITARMRMPDPTFIQVASFERRVPACAHAFAFSRTFPPATQHVTVRLLGPIGCHEHVAPALVGIHEVLGIRIPPSSWTTTDEAQARHDEEGPIAIGHFGIPP